MLIYVIPDLDLVSLIFEHVSHIRRTTDLEVNGGGGGFLARLSSLY